jgi:hypothetical protein
MVTLLISKTSHKTNKINTFYVFIQIKSYYDHVIV